MPTPLQTTPMLQVDNTAGPTTFNAASPFTARSFALFSASYFSAANQIRRVEIGGTPAYLAWVQAATSGPNFGRAYFFVAENLAGGSTAINVEFTGGSDNYVTGTVVEYAAGLIAGVGSVVGASGSSAAPAVTLSPIQGYCHLHALMMNNSGSAACAISGPGGAYTDTFTEQNDSIHTAGRHSWVENTSLGAKTATFAQNSGAWAAIMLELRLAFKPLMGQACL